ncbi:galanin peptides [Rhynchocyon petersi]
MPRRSALLLAALVLAAALNATPGLGAPVSAKRGWTLNSAGYLLGPHAIDNHRSFHEKHGLTGKRELQLDDDARPGSFDRPLPESSVVRTIMDFLTFLQLKEAGALQDLPTALSLEDTEQTSLLVLPLIKTCFLHSAHSPPLPRLLLTPSSHFPSILKP